MFLLAAQCLALVLLGAMLQNKHRALLVDLTLSRIEIQAGDIEGALRTGVLTGLHPEEIHQLELAVRRLKAAEPAIADIEVLAARSGSAYVVFASDPERIGLDVPHEEWRRLANPHGIQHAAGTAGPVLSVAVRDAGDEPAAVVRVRADPEPLARTGKQIAEALWSRLGIVLALMIVATATALALLRRRRLDGKRLHSAILAVALVATVASGADLAWYARGLLAENLTPAVTAKVGGVGAFVAGKVARASDLGLPIDKLPKIGDYFAGIMARHPEVAALRLTGGDGAAIAALGSSGGPWHEFQAGSSWVGAAMNDEFVSERLLELAADVGIVLLVAVLVFRELLAGLLGSLSGGGSAAGERLQALRLPLFLFILTEEMSRSFLPLFLRQFPVDTALLTPETATGLPIAIYMLCFALATPFAGRWADRWGVGRTFAAGVVLCLAGFAWTALAGNYWQLLPARALCALGYATGTMACQRQLILLSGPQDRARGLALFVGAVVVAAICGSALGGVLADQFGFRPVFAFSALLALLALLVFRAAQGGTPVATDAPPPPMRLADLAALLRRPRFAALMLGGAIPAKIALAGFLFYLTPLLLHPLGYSPAAIGRAVMVYFVLVAAINPLASWASDRYGLRLSLTLAGGILIALGGLAAWPGSPLATDVAVWVGIAALGVGTGLATAPMQALASEIGATAGATSVAVVLRTVERLGSVIGPLWAGAWLAGAGGSGAMAAIGVVVLAGTLLCVAARGRAA